MLSNLFIWEIRLKKFRLCCRERYLGGQKLCKYYFLLRFCNRDATCIWSLSIYYYCWSGSRSFVIHWEKSVPTVAMWQRKKKKFLSKCVWACSYFFFFPFLTCLLYPTFYIFLFLLIIYFLLFTQNYYWCYFKISIQGFVIWFYHLYNKNNADQEFITNFRIGIMPCRWHVFISYNHIRGCCSELDLVFKWRAILKRKLNCTIMYVFCLSFTC